jgi:pyruvate kinase
MLSSVGIPQAFTHLHNPVVAAAMRGDPQAKKMVGASRYAGLGGHQPLAPVTAPDGHRAWGATTPCGLTHVYTKADQLFRPPVHTLIVATLGPATDRGDTLRQLIENGLGIARLNFSHGTHDEHLARAQQVRAVAAELGVQVGIMGDLQGAKIRVGKFDGKVQLEKGQTFVLDANRTTPGDQHGVGLDYTALPEDIRRRMAADGDGPAHLVLNDGKVRLRVDSIVDGAVHTTVVRGGELSSNKGVNLEGGGLSAPALTDKDAVDARFAVQTIGVDLLAVSFPKGPGCMESAQALVDAALPDGALPPGLIAKLEQKVAVEPPVLDLVTAACSGGVMVAAGDLADEVGLTRLPDYQTRILESAHGQGKFSIAATGMLDSMIENEIPTRAEVRSIADAVKSGANAVMLSAETAAGDYPVEALATMAEVVVNTELAMARM